MHIRFLSLLFLVASVGPGALIAQRTNYQGLVLNIQQQIENNDLQAARASLASALKLYPHDGGLENLRGVIEIQSGNRDAARQAFTLAIARSPKLTSAYLNLARLEMESADHDTKSAEQALHLYTTALTIEPSSEEAEYGAATAAMWLHQYAVSLTHLEKLSLANNSQPRVQAVLCADELGLVHKDAAEHAAAAMSASPDLSESDVMLALPALRAAHRADLLEELLSAANAHQPLSASGLRTLGLAQEAQGNKQQAKGTLERVYEMQPGDTAPLIDLARIALADGDKSAALGYIAHARAIAPNDANLVYEYGFICLQLNLLREARAAVAEAVRLAPDNATYLLTMGTIATGGEALPYLQRYRDLRPNDAVGFLASGIAYLDNNGAEDAMVWLTKASTHKETAAWAYYYLGRLLNQQAKFNEALADLRQSDTLQPNQAEVLAEMGESYLLLKQYPEAATQLRRALALAPENYIANYALLRLYSQTNDEHRSEQAKRFAALRTEKEDQYRDAMRVIEARPQPVSEDRP